MKKNDSQVLIAFNKLSENDTLDLIIALIDHDGNLLSYSQYQELNNLVDIAMVSDSSYVFATNDELWRLSLINDSYNIHLLTNQFSKFIETYQDYQIEKISQKVENFGKIENFGFWNILDFWKNGKFKMEK